MGKFAFVDSNNYCVAEIDKEGGNPLVTGKLAHVDAKHFTTSTAKQSKVSLRASLWPPARVARCAEPPSKGFRRCGKVTHTMERRTQSVALQRTRLVGESTKL